MKPSWIAFPMFVFVALTLCALSAEAQVVLSGSAFGSGGVLTGGGLRLIGSAGQPAAGIVSGAANTHRAGLYLRLIPPCSAWGEVGF